MQSTEPPTAEASPRRWSNIRIYFPTRFPSQISSSDFDSLSLDQPKASIIIWLFISHVEISRYERNENVLFSDENCAIVAANSDSGRLS